MPSKQLYFNNRESLACVAVPTHKSTLIGEEEKAFLNTLSVMKQWQVFVLVKAGVDTQYFNKIGITYSNLRVVQLEPGFLGSIEAYNIMALSRHFYQMFADFKYILICHTDVWLFRDNLAEWCSMNYDYIGAPLFLPEPLKYQNLKQLMAPFCGNGGLSLRKVKTMMSLTTKTTLDFNWSLACRALVFLIQNGRPDLVPYLFSVAKQVTTDPYRYQAAHNIYEDVMLSGLLPLRNQSIKVADPETASRFALEVNAEEFINCHASFELPMGVHGYEKHFNHATLSRLKQGHEANSRSSVRGGIEVRQPSRVTIVTAVKNIVQSGRKDVLIQAAKSVVRQTYPYLEHIVVDGDSSDETVAFIKRCAPMKYARLVIKKDNSVWDGMQTGLHEASGDIVNFLNSDDFFIDERAVSRIVDSMSKNRALWAFSDASIHRPNGTTYNFPTNIYGIYSCLGIVHQTMFVDRSLMLKAAPLASHHITRENFCMMLLHVNKFRYVHLNASLVAYREGGLSSTEYGGNNLEKTRTDFAEYFYTLIGKRWRLTYLECLGMFGWNCLSDFSFKDNIRLAAKLRPLGLKANFLSKLIERYRLRK